MFPNDHIVFASQDFKRRFLLKRRVARVIYLDIPVIIRVVLPAVGLVLRETLLYDPIVRAVDGVILFKPLRHAPVPYILARAVVQKDNIGTFASRLRANAIVHRREKEDRSKKTEDSAELIFYHTGLLQGYWYGGKAGILTSTIS